MLCVLQASFVSDDSTNISIDDPDFWQKWAAKANLDLEQLANKVYDTSVCVCVCLYVCQSVCTCTMNVCVYVCVLPDHG